MAKYIPIDGTTAHWYSRDGFPHYEADLRKAKKEGLLPGAAAISRVIAKPALDSWKQNQLLSYTYSMMRDPVTGQSEEESTEEFLARVVEAYGEPLKQAAERGSEIHAALQWHIESPDSEDPAEYRDPSVTDALRWIDSHLERCWNNIAKSTPTISLAHSEDSVVNITEGYAGRVDYWGPYGPEGSRDLAVVDFKSRKVNMSQYKTRRNGPQPRFYDEDCMQLAAYAEAVKVTYKLKEAPRIVSLVISTNPDLEGSYPKEWTREEQKRGLMMFRLSLSLWRIMKNFPYREKETRMVECSWCKTIASSKVKPRSDRAFYCSACRSEGVPNRVAQQRYVARAKTNGKIHYGS